MRAAHRRLLEVIDVLQKVLPRSMEKDGECLTFRTVGAGH